MDYGLIGEKLSHSYSKEIHESLGKYEYELREIPENELEEFFKKRNFKAVNVTIPYKEKVIPFLDFISQNAKMIGSVNTVVCKGDKLYGYNTDYFGMKNQLKYMGVDLKDKKVLIFGTGGTSKTAYALSKQEKASEIFIVSRYKTDSTITYDEALRNHNDAQFIFNTTPVGMYPKTDKKIIDLSCFNNLSGVFDAIYNPLQSLFVQEGLKKNIPSAGGLYMLVSQAVYASSLFTMSEPENELIDDVYKIILNEKQGIALIGMPSCGKSTLGKILSLKTGRELYDTDEMIKEKCNMDISKIFEKFGEEYFRNIESQVVFEASQKGGRIISTGGGVILREENIVNLKKNCKVIFLDRDLDKLISTSDRPLSKNDDDLKDLYCKRIDLYRQYADLTVKCNENPEEIALNIIKELSK